MAFFTHRNGGFDIHNEIEDLRTQIAALARSASRHGASAGHGLRKEAGDLYEELGERVADAMPVIRRRARMFEGAIREHPAQAVAIIGLAAFAVAAICVLGGGRR